MNDVMAPALDLDTWLTATRIGASAPGGAPAAATQWTIPGAVRSLAALWGAPMATWAVAMGMSLIATTLTCLAGTSGDVTHFVRFCWLAPIGLNGIALVAGIVAAFGGPHRWLGALAALLSPVLAFGQLVLPVFILLALHPLHLGA